MAFPKDTESISLGQVSTIYGTAAAADASNTVYDLTMTTCSIGGLNGLKYYDSIGTKYTIAASAGNPFSLGTLRGKFANITTINFSVSNSSSTLIALGPLRVTANVRITGTIIAIGIYIISFNANIEGWGSDQGDTVEYIKVAFVDGNNYNSGGSFGTTFTYGTKETVSMGAEVKVGDSRNSLVKATVVKGYVYPDYFNRN